MGKVRFRYAHRLIEIAGKAEEACELPTPLSVEEAVQDLGKRYGPLFRRELDLMSSDFGKTAPFYLVFVDGKRVPEARRRDPLVLEGSEISFLPLMSGG